MSNLVHHVVRRGLIVARDQYNDFQNDHNGFQIGTTDENGVFTANEPEKPTFKLPVWGGLILAATVFAYLFAMFAIRYTLELLMTTLTTVETPSYTPVALPPTSSGAPLLGEDTKTSEEEQLKLDSDLTLIKNKPITAKIRTTFKHLRAVAGPWSRFRGLHVAAIYALGYQLIHSLSLSLLPYSLRSSLFEALTAVATAVLLTRLSATWTHRVISLPVDKPWYRRLTSRATVKKLLLPTAAWATAEQIAMYFPQSLFNSVGLDRFAYDPHHLWSSSPETQRRVMIHSWLVIFVALALVILVVLPAQVTLVRVQASVLPEEDEPIVPFDRTFGGKVVPESEGGKGVLGMLDAWKTFEWSSRLRLVGLYMKIIAIQMFTTLVFVLLMIGELRMIVGREGFDQGVKKMTRRE